MTCFVPNLILVLLLNIIPNNVFQTNSLTVAIAPQCFVGPERTSVSETIRKPSPDWLRKEKYFLWNAGICPIVEILWKNCSPRKISLKSGNRLLSFGQKMIFNMVTVRHLECKKIIFGHVTAIKFSMCCCAPNFIKIG